MRLRRDPTLFARSGFPLIVACSRAETCYLSSLREAGFIEGFRAQLNGTRLGFPVVCFAFVHLASQAEADLAAFQKAVSGWSAVRECWTLSGDDDFLMKCVTQDLPGLQAFIGEITATPNVRNVRTALALSKVKDLGFVPVPEA
jgi:DNA-binding Lrp family transcriptional regulator